MKVKYWGIQNKSLSENQQQTAGGIIKQPLLEYQKKKFIQKSNEYTGEKMLRKHIGESTEKTFQKSWANMWWKSKRKSM